MQALRYLLFTALLGMIVAVAGVMLLAATPTGFVWLSKQADGLVPGRLTISNPAGSLLTSLHANEVSYVLDSLTISARDIRLRLNWLALLAGEVRLSDLHAVRLDITVAEKKTPNATPGDWPEVSVPIALRVPNGTLDELQLHLPGFQNSFTAIQLDAALIGDRLRAFKIAATAYNLPVTGQARLSLSGAWHYSGALSAELDGASWPEGNARVDFTGDRHQLRLSNFELSAMGGRITGDARLDFNSLEAVATLAVDGVGLAAGQTGSPTLAYARVTAAGRLPDGIRVDVDNAELLSGEHRGQLSGQVDWDGRALHTDSLTLAENDNRVTFAGELYPTPGGRITVTAPNPGNWVPGATGQIHGAATFTVAGPASSHDGLLSRVAFRLGADATEFTWKAGHAATASIQADGRLDDFRWQAAGQTDTGHADLRGSAQLRDKQLRVHVASADFTPDGLPEWQLAQPALVTAAIDPASPSITVSPHCWTAEPGRLCSDTFRYTPGSINLTARVEPFDLAGLPLRDELGYRLSGRGHIQLELGGRPDNPTGALVWQQGSSQIAWTDQHGRTLESNLSAARIDLRLDDHHLSLVASAEGENGVRLDAKAVTDDWLDAATPVNGTVTAHFPDIALFAPLLERFASLDETAGELSAELTFGGNRNNPTLTGQAKLQGGRTLVRALGIELRDVSLTASANGASSITFNGSGISGPGRLELKGSANWNRDKTLHATLAARGTNVTVLRFPQQVVNASPDVTAELNGNTLTVSGTVDVPFADVTLQDIPVTARSPSDDAKVIRPTKPARRRDKLTVVSDLELRLGDDVRFAGFGLQTTLGGRLRLRTKANSATPFLEGSVQSREGTFVAFQRELGIERGVLLFNGPADNPTVDVRAVRELRYEGDDIKIVISLNGPLQHMQTRLSGEPPMSETDALSYLVLGRPSRVADNSDADQLSAAAIALGMVNSLPVTDILRESLGVDEIEVEGNTRETSAIAASKRIGDKLYIRYSYGLFERIGRFVIRYDIGRGFSLEAGSGQEQTIDLLYSIDR